MSKPDERILVRVTLVYGNAAEVAVTDYKDIEDAMDRGIVLDGCYPGSTSSLCWRINGKHIVHYLTDDEHDIVADRFNVSPSDESATSTDEHPARELA